MREFDELDFGQWAGRSFDELHNDPRWQQWNVNRGTASPPQGETMHDLQGRVLRGILSAVEAHPNQSVAIVSHAEPIRAAILHFRQISVNEFARVKVDPGSLTTVEFQNGKCSSIHENENIDGEAVAA
jgi:probable phosphoglycerate mutase